MSVAPYPHEPGCPECRARGDCDVCGGPAAQSWDRCTNGRCHRCHAETCTLGGGVSPGHGYGTHEDAKKAYERRQGERGLAAAASTSPETSSTRD